MGFSILALSCQIVQNLFVVEMLGSGLRSDGQRLSQITIHVDHILLVLLNHLLLDVMGLSLVIVQLINPKLLKFLHLLLLRDYNFLNLYHFKKGVSY